MPWLYAASARNVRSGSPMWATQLILHQREIARSADDALAGIEPVLHLEAVGGLLGEHHEAAHARGRGGTRVPVGFLVADRGDEAPVDPAHLLAFLEVGLHLRQAGRDVLEQRAGVDGAEFRRMAVVAVHEALQGAVAAQPLEERHGGGEDLLLFTCGDEPGVFHGLADVERDLQLREVSPGERVAVRFHERVVELAVGHLVEELRGAVSGRRYDRHRGHRRAGRAGNRPRSRRSRRCACRRCPSATSASGPPRARRSGAGS